MDRDLHKVIVIGTSLGLSSQIAALFPEPKPVRQLTERGTRAMAAAEARRQKRIEKRKARTT